MKLPLLFIGIAALLAFFKLHQFRLKQDERNISLAREVQTLKENRERLEEELSGKQKKWISLNNQLADRSDVLQSASSLSSTNQSINPPPPDPARHGGGWSKEQGFFYFPKKLLAQVDYRPLEHDRLTEEASMIFGMSEGEQSQVNGALKRLFDGYRSTELAKMRAIEPPTGWNGIGSLSGAALDNVVAYQIPSLKSEIESMRQSFTQELTTALGQNRASAFQEAIDSHILANVDDLGREERTIGFLWFNEKDGSRSLWYAEGQGSFQRVPEGVAPDSQIAYYANLFQVQLPARHLK